MGQKIGQELHADGLVVAADGAGGGGRCRRRRAPKKGYVPVLVGPAAESAERLLLSVRMLGEPEVAALLDMAECELGCRQEGVLWIPCDAEHFRRVVSGGLR